MTPFRLLAPAKLNLYLDVLGWRPDGFHELDTLFERIDLADELTFEPRPAGLQLTCDDPALPVGPENLVTRAAAALQRAAGIGTGAAIHLAKRTPVASGLGGGSSDAATTLVGLNRLWGLEWPKARLVELAAELGSDVPFFLEEQPFAIGRGRGERCEPVAGRTPVLWHVLVVPPVELSTKAIFTDYAAAAGASSRQKTSPNRPSSLTVPARSSSITAHALCNGSLGELARGLWNSLEPVAIRRCPIIQEIQAQLRDSGCFGVLMSGSGPSVFGLCQDADHAAAVVQRLGAVLPNREGRPDLASRPWVLRAVRTCHGSRPWASCGS